MKKPTTPPDEPGRLASLQSLGILDTPPEERFDRVTRLASRLFGVPIALVSLVDANRQWFKSREGLEATETSREISFCGHAILGREVMVVPDARADERFADNPLVTGDPAIRFYAGCPIAAPSGHTVGTLCLISPEPRTLDEEDLRLFRDLAEMVERELAAVQLATLDELTGISNRRGFLALAEHGLATCRRMERPASLLFIDLDRFKAINDEHGHEAGDRALVELAEVLLDCFRSSDVVARLGGDEFSVLLTGTDGEGAKRPLAALAERVASLNAEPDRSFQLEYSVGCVAYDPARHATLAELLKEADARMYAAKQSSRD